MLQQLLVPLDGSAAAELALPVACGLARRLRTPVTLVHVVERAAPETVHGQPHLGTADAARAYLADRARSAFPDDVTVECQVHDGSAGDVPRGILASVKAHTSTLIVMCPHGRRGLPVLLRSEVAQRIVADGGTPVLLVPPSLKMAAEFRCRTLLVALDGNEVHEQALPLARDIAKACGATIRLVLAVPTPGTLPNGVAAAGRLLPRTSRAVLEIAREEAAEYLRRHIACLKSIGVSASADIRRGDAAKAIAAAARESDADVIVLTTHRRIGMRAFWAGSVAPRVASYSKAPVLLVPIDRRAEWPPRHS